MVLWCRFIDRRTLIELVEGGPVCRVCGFALLPAGFDGRRFFFLCVAGEVLRSLCSLSTRKKGSFRGIVTRIEFVTRWQRQAASHLLRESYIVVESVVNIYHGEVNTT